MRSVQERTEIAEKRAKLAQSLFIVAFLLACVSTGTAVVDAVIDESIWMYWTLGYVAGVTFAVGGYMAARASAYVPG